LERRHNDTRKRPAWHEALTYFLIVGAMMLGTGLGALLAMWWRSK